MVCTGEERTGVVLSSLVRASSDMYNIFAAFSSNRVRRDEKAKRLSGGRISQACPRTWSVEVPIYTPSPFLFPSSKVKSNNPHFSLMLPVISGFITNRFRRTHSPLLTCTVLCCTMWLIRGVLWRRVVVDGNRIVPSARV